MLFCILAPPRVLLNLPFGSVRVVCPLPVSSEDAVSLLARTEDILLPPVATKEVALLPVSIKDVPPSPSSAKVITLHLVSAKVFCPLPVFESSKDAADTSLHKGNCSSGGHSSITRIYQGHRFVPVFAKVVSPLQDLSQDVDPLRTSLHLLTSMMSPASGFTDIAMSPPPCFTNIVVFLLASLMWWSFQTASWRPRGLGFRGIDALSWSWHALLCHLTSRWPIKRELLTYHVNISSLKSN